MVSVECHGNERHAPSGSSYAESCSSVDSAKETEPWASRYTNVAPLPTFRGTAGECTVRHLSRFWKVCRANNARTVEDMKRIFPVTLHDEAAVWYDLNIEPYESSLSWEEIKQSFVEAYSGPVKADELRADLLMLRQGRAETVRSYFLRLQWTVKALLPYDHVSDSLIIDIFTDGLEENCRDWIVAHRPGTLDKALALAFQYEQGKAIRELQDKVLELGLNDARKERIIGLWGIRRDETEVTAMGIGEARHGSRNVPEEKSGITVQHSDQRSMPRCKCSKHKCRMEKQEMKTRN